MQIFAKKPIITDLNLYQKGNEKEQKGCDVIAY